MNSRERVDEGKPSREKLQRQLREFADFGIERIVKDRKTDASHVDA